MLCFHCNNIRFPNSYHPKGDSVHKVHHSQDELPGNCKQAQDISHEKEEMTEPNDLNTIHCVKDLTELKLVSEDRYVDAFTNSLQIIFLYYATDIQNTISSVSMDILLAIHHYLWDKVIDIFPQYNGHCIITRTVTHITVSDIINLGQCIVNQAPLNKLDKIFLEQLHKTTNSPNSQNSLQAQYVELLQTVSRLTKMMENRERIAGAKI